MTALTHENNFLHSFIKGLGSMLSFSPPPQFSQIKAKSNAEMWAEAWKMTGDSMYKAMGRTPPPPPPPLSDEELEEAVAMYINENQSKLCSKIGETQNLSFMVTRKISEEGNIYAAESKHEIFITVKIEQAEQR